MKTESRRGQHEHRKDPSDCRHESLVKVEESGINDVDTDVLIYACSTCGKTFTITDF